uniref:C-type lectin domain-containing protein n=1 Tax=Nothobranchius kadleci TaxID=1051664 RepID=A0A1A8C313_NOTKA
MEMQTIPSQGTETGGEALLEVKPQEEAESAYDTLQSPSEDFYSDALISVPAKATKGRQVGGSERLYRYGCFALTGVCFILLLTVILLSLKLGSQACPVEHCPKQISQNQHHCYQQCAKGWLPYGKSCYFLSTLRLSWADSQKNCSSGGGSLAVISSRGVQHFLTRTGNLTYWIGLRKNTTEWNWVNNTQLQQNYWSGSTIRSNCAYLSSEAPEEKNWETASCHALNYFICQLEL